MSGWLTLLFSVMHTCGPLAGSDFRIFGAKTLETAGEKTQKHENRYPHRESNPGRLGENQESSPLDHMGDLSIVKHCRFLTRKPGHLERLHRVLKYI